MAVNDEDEDEDDVDDGDDDNGGSLADGSALAFSIYTVVRTICYCICRLQLLSPPFLSLSLME